MKYSLHKLPVVANIDKSYDQLIEDVKNYPPREKSKLSAFIWWRLCDRVPTEDIECLKANISYKLTDDMDVFEVQELLIEYGFYPDYVENQTKSTVNELTRRS